MTVVFVVIGLAVAAGIVLVAVGFVRAPVPPTPDRPVAELPVTGLGKVDVDEVRFGVGLRGYRMDEVDGVLDRVAAELAARDARVAELEAALAGPIAAGRAPAPSGPGPVVSGQRDESAGTGSPEPA